MGGKFLRGAAYAALAALITLTSCQGVVGYDDERAAATLGLPQGVETSP
jgi:hypothetical protein